MKLVCSVMYLSHVQMDMVSKPRNKINQSQLARAPFGDMVDFIILCVCCAVTSNTKHGYEKLVGSATYGIRMKHTSCRTIPVNMTFSSEIEYLLYCICLMGVFGEQSKELNFIR